MGQEFSDETILEEEEEVVVFECWANRPVATNTTSRKARNSRVEEKESNTPCTRTTIPRDSRVEEEEYDTPTNHQTRIVKHAKGTLGIVVSRGLKSFCLSKNFDIGTTTGKLLQTPGCKKCWEALFTKNLLHEMDRTCCRNRIFIHGKVIMKPGHFLACRWRCEDCTKSYGKPVDTRKRRISEMCVDCGGPCTIVQLKVVQGRYEVALVHFNKKFPRTVEPLQVVEEPVVESANRSEVPSRRKKKKKKKKKKTVPALGEDPALVARRFQKEEDEEAARRLQNEMYHHPPGSYESEPIQQPPTPSVPEAPSPLEQVNFMVPVSGVEVDSPLPNQKEQTPTQVGFMMPVSGTQINKEEEEESGEESEDEEEEENKCKVCNENRACLLMIPCGHVLCNDCSDEVDECPFCLRVIVKRVKFNNYFL